jgi:tetratricopeptide (TPR) repeat protein/tRNA A-37 threonylcarbamoyl transferase component Bud32
MTSLECPQEETIVAFAEGRLSSDALARIESHALTCTLCQDLLAAAMGTGTFTHRAADDGVGAAGSRQGPHLVESTIEPIAEGAILAGRYEVHELIGHGGAGQVFKATDRELGERVALKALRPELAADHKWRRRLVREVRVARAIRHPNVCRVFELGTDRGRSFITMELATRGTLRDALPRRADQGDARTGADPSADASWASRLTDARTVCAGLGALHAVGVTHRDVTPQNVLRMGDGRLVLSDFGLAVADRESTTFQGGTLVYMAPEVIAGASADQRADVWQLGLLLHHLLFGCAAEWDRRGAQVALRRPAGVDVSAVVEELWALCAACLSHDPAARPASAVEVAGRLAAAEAAKPRGRWSRAWLRGRRIARRREVRVALFILIASGMAIETARIATRQRLCKDGPSRVAGIWDGPRREAVQKAFLRSGRPRTAEVFAMVASMIDNHLSRWVAAYTDACEATHVRGEQSAELLDLRMTCLNENLDATRTLSRVLSEADTTVVEHAVEAASTLDDFSRCADVRRLRSLPLPPKDPLARKAAERLTSEVKEANVLYEVRQIPRSLVLAEQAIEDAKRIDYCPGLAAALCVKGYALSEQSAELAKAILEQAVSMAETCGDDQTIAAAAVGLVFVSNLASADTWAAFAEAAIRRLGGNPKLESWLQNNIGPLRYREGRFDEAMSAERNAITLKEARLGPDSVDVGVSVDNLANLLYLVGRTEEALKESSRVLAIYTHWLDPGNTTFLDALFHRGLMLLAKGDVEEAQALFMRSFDVASGHAATDISIAEALDGLGQAALAQNKPSQAIIYLKRAISFYRRMADLVWMDLPGARFALARALDQIDHFDTRAHRLAIEARNEYPTFPGFDKQRRAIDKWLAERGEHSSSRRSSK